MEFKLVVTKSQKATTCCLLMAVPGAINGSQFIGNAKHLSSVLLQYPDVIDDSLKKEQEIRSLIQIL